MAVLQIDKKSLLLFLLFCATHLSATTIVLIRNSQGVFIGADSRIVDQRGESLGVECKVKRIGDYFFAHAGLGMDDQFGFNIQSIARDVFSTKRAFNDQFEIFSETVARECSTYLERIRNQRHDLFDRMTSGKVNIETAIAGRDEKGAPFFQVLKFTAAGSAHDVKITITIRYACPGDCDGGNVIVMLGQMAFSEEMVEKSAYGMMRHPAEAINRIINREIENNDRVGPPITILKIGYQDTQWIQHSELCVDP